MVPVSIENNPVLHSSKSNVVLSKLEIFNKPDLLHQVFL
jgi:hypothetical protein